MPCIKKCETVIISKKGVAILVTPFLQYKVNLSCTVSLVYCKMKVTVSGSEQIQVNK